MAIDLTKFTEALNMQKTIEQEAKAAELVAAKQSNVPMMRKNLRGWVKYYKDLHKAGRVSGELFKLDFDKGHTYTTEMLKVLKDKAMQDNIKTGIRQIIDIEDGRSFEVNVTADAVAILCAAKLSAASGMPIMHILGAWSYYGSATIPESMLQYASDEIAQLAIALTAAKYPIGALYSDAVKLLKAPGADEKKVITYLLEESGTIKYISSSSSDGYLTPKFKDYDDYVAAGGPENDSSNWMYHAGCMDWEDEISLNNIDLDKASSNTKLADWLIKYAIEQPDRCVPVTDLPTWLKERYDEIRNGTEN